MSRYNSIDCPICGRPLEQGGEVVVCPDCGAPYHRSCYLEKGACIFPELHEKGESWQPPQKEEAYNHPAGVHCSRCGTLNPPHGLFCQVCGNQLRGNEQASAGQTPPGGQTGGTAYPPPFGMPFPPPFGGAGEQIPPEMPLNPYTTPFGGVAPDEEIDGVSAKDLAIFVSKNSHYFLPHFKRLSQTKTKIINWPGVLFGGGYFLYRKMYGLGILAYLAELIIWIPYGILYFQAVLNGSQDMAADAGMIYYLCQFLDLAVRLFCGFFANSFYFSHCKKKIAELKESKLSEDEYHAALSRKGSVAVKLITALLVGYGVVMLISFLIMLPMLLSGI